MKEIKEKYIRAIMDMATRFADTSVDERLHVGALIYNPTLRSIISMGVNGTPEGWHTNKCQDETGVTKPEVRHAESAALKKLQMSPLGAEGCYMFISHAPCFYCAIDIVEAGIKRVYFVEEYRKDEGLFYLLQRGVKLFRVTPNSVDFIYRLERTQ